MELLISLLGLTGLGLLFLGLMLKKLKPGSSIAQRAFILLWVLSGLLFAASMLFYGNPYHQAIDPVDGEGYSPFGDGQLSTILFYTLLFYGSLFLLWWKGIGLPPLTAVLSAVMVVIGLILNVFLFIQLVGYDPSSIDMYVSYSGMFVLLPLPVFNILGSLTILAGSVFARTQAATTRQYQHPFLNRLNLLLANNLNRPLWVLLLLLPVLLLCTLILLLFGQTHDSLIKVFTDTTTWMFSQKQHPPILDHQGHYLCTVAAKGSPNIVKPLKLGTRGGRTIIVNRQLQVANAFEEWVRDISPNMHRLIRRKYDQYGYNLSVKINSAGRSNITYMVMKPLEWFFVVCLYLFCPNPEQKIRKQYGCAQKNGSDM